MFVRIAWITRQKRQGERRDLHRLGGRPNRNGDDLGITARDFDKMTRTLFDRQT